MLEQLGSSTEWQRVVATSEAPVLQPSPSPPPPTTTLGLAVRPSAPSITDEPAIQIEIEREISGGGVSDEVMDLLRQLDSGSKPSSNLRLSGGSSRSEQTHHPPAPKIDIVEAPVDLPNMTFAQALPHITQLAQNQKALKHLRNVSGSNAWANGYPASHYLNYSFLPTTRSRKNKTISKDVIGRNVKGSRKLSLPG